MIGQLREILRLCFRQSNCFSNRKYIFDTENQPDIYLNSICMIFSWLVLNS